MRHFLAVIIVLVACRPDTASVEPPSGASHAATGRAQRPVLSSTTLLATADAARREAERLATPEAWDAAAQAYEAVSQTCTEVASCRAAAHSVMQARKQAMYLQRIPRPSMSSPTPLPLPPRVDALVDASERYLRLAEPADPEIPAARFAIASAYGRYNWTDDAIPRLEDIVRTFPETEVAGNAANMLLDLLNRAGQIDELKRWAVALLADQTLLAANPTLRGTLEGIVAPRRNTH